MDPYTFSLVLGVSGLGVMALGGIGHHGGHASHSTHDHAGAGAHTGPGAHGTLAHHHSADHASHHDSTHSTVASQLWVLLSPRVFFSLAVGFGAAGLVLVRWVPEPWLALGAVLGAVGFEGCLVRPIWNRLLGFASNPARTLESAVFDVAEAVTDFDAQGQGLIVLELDGQVVQVLARLSPDERALGVHIRRGARVRIEEVDARRNRCLVSSMNA